ncbi:TetR family transcriptional regulator [Streptomyces sp. SID13666]|uniref:TetR/AcrR family transcriptional regulator n=1 Tax=unclassified Streptomyces TaxID=2593676 RepID=UPI0013C18109|nr:MULTISPECIES: TetR family transcriptional regulator [unclassified Streptomyces]NEA57071.1 TetR family transcriptional regulator [Streptomyces sp. SID13666]NEA74816.1 TetR family transcriptional regulator [Streptomyces sp. SID13588]
MARRYDPDRRRRIIDAAIRVVGERGIAGLSHRSVAAEADVPLGSTTYHFATLDDLLVAALRQANEGFAQSIKDSPLFADPSSGPGSEQGSGPVAGPGDGLESRVEPATSAAVADELSRLLEVWLSGDRTLIELDYDLYLAALRREAVRPIAAEWVDQATTLLATRTDPATARALIALIDGICLQVLLTGGTYDRAYAREMFGRLLG